MNDISNDQNNGPTLEIEKLSLADIKEMRLKGDYPTALNSIAELEDSLQIEKAICYYHQGEYQLVLDAVDAANDSPAALQIQLNVYSYGKGFRDEDKVLEIIEKLGPTVSNLNSEVISALKPDSTFSPQNLMERGDAIITPLTPYTATLASAHLSHNLARLAMDKLDDLPKAELLIDKAIELYGEDTHLHHRAAANYWKTKILDKQSKFVEAVSAGEESVVLWETQIEINLEEEQFRKKLAGAQNRLADLILLRDERE